MKPADVRTFGALQQSPELPRGQTGDNDPHRRRLVLDKFAAGE